MKRLIEQIIDYIIGHPLFKWLMSWTKTTTLPGFAKIPIYDIATFIHNELKRNKLTVRARAIAFSFMLALFPSIIFFFSLLPYIPIQNLDATLLDFMKDLMPVNAYELLQSTVTDLVIIPRGGLLSVGFILAIWFSSNGVFSIMSTFNKAYPETFRKRNIFQIRGVAFQIMLILFLLLIASVLFIVLGGRILTLALEVINASQFSYIAITILRWLVILALFYSAISTIYRLGPATRRKFPFISPGATVATILTIFISLIFSFFVNEFGRYNQVYGSLGTLIVSMVWLQLNSLILLIGFELNAGIAVNRDLKAKREDEDDGE